MEGPKRNLPSDGEKDSSEDENCIYYEEEESESEPEVEDTNWDEDCKLLSTKASFQLTGYYSNPGQDPESLKRIKPNPPGINENLLSQQFITNLKANWVSSIPIVNENVELIICPFKVCIFNDFLSDPDFIHKLQQEFYEVEWSRRSMDLYEFFQSQDLKKLGHHKNIAIFYEFLQQQLMEYVAKITGFELTHISATCSYYSNTDYLLVHDDQQDDRLVAFVFYFCASKGWDSASGGALQLLNKDEEGHPKETVRDIFPKNNQLVIFPVTNDSYHQVSEVIAIENCRFSINGWFHTSKTPIFTTPKFMPISQSIYNPENSKKSIELDLDLELWLADSYLDSKVGKQIQNYFEENSEISLNNFLKPECLKEVKNILHSNTMKFIKMGPPNRYNYEILDRNQDLPNTLERFINMFQSQQFFCLLHKYTDLELVTVKIELQKWKPGYYSLLTDYDWLKHKELDLVLHFGCSDNSGVIGARTQYVASDEEEIQNALITLEPEENNLNLVYRDTARFTKYFSKSSRISCFYTLLCSYSEANTE